MEYLDVLSDMGVRTGVVLSEEEVHKNALWSKSVICVIINENNEILMQKRATTKEKFPGLWDLSLAAHVHTGEDSIRTLVKKMNEEIGVRLNINISAKDCRFVTAFQNEHQYNANGIDYHVKNFYEMFVVFFNVNVEDCEFNDGEVDEVKYMKIFDIIKLKKENMLHPRTEWIDAVKKYLNSF